MGGKIGRDAGYEIRDEDIENADALLHWCNFGTFDVDAFTSYYVYWK
ncbi:MAG: hypothetical protein ACKN9X_01925 [Candidatus Methylopumilus sp.]